MIDAATILAEAGDIKRFFYRKKREHGKHHMTVARVVARKLTTVIYAVLRDGKPYELKKFC